MSVPRKLEPTPMRVLGVAETSGLAERDKNFMLGSPSLAARWWAAATA